MEGAEKLAMAIDWGSPEDTPTQYVNEMTVQFTGHEYILSFFEVKYPFLAGTPEQQKEQAESRDKVRAVCVARLLVTPDRMPTIVQVLSKYLEAVASQEITKE